MTKKIEFISELITEKQYNYIKALVKKYKAFDCNLVLLRKDGLEIKVNDFDDEYSHFIRDIKENRDYLIEIFTKSNASKIIEKLKHFDERYLDKIIIAIKKSFEQGDEK